MENEILQQILVEIKGLRTEAVSTNKKLEGLRESVVVLQQGVGEVRYELQNFKEVLSDRVIWQNDSITIQTKEGTVIYGVIHKTPGK